MSETKEKEVKSEDKEEKLSKRSVFPEIYALTNEEGTGYDIEVYLPGVEKNTIDLKMAKDYIRIAGESENIKYIGDYQLCCPIEPTKAKSTYKEGLLKIHVPFKQIELETIDVEIE
ncbi:MAG: Hsp20/alpha crystallin family protein [Promethearchaeota archaeon]